MSTQGKLIKVLPGSSLSSNCFTNDTLKLVNISSSKELDEYVVLESHMYARIFGKKKITAKDSRKRLSVVKIDYNGKAIHRAYMSVPATDFKKEFVGLTTNSIYLLSGSDGNTVSLLSNVTLSKGNKLIYFWTHPNAAVRMALKIGVWGIACTIVTSFLFFFLSIMQK